MSTFDGFVRAEPEASLEFPDVRFDYFRPLPGKPPPLANFLSHVHSDHLQGLESFRSTFIYCTAATRAIVLRLERFPHRINFSKGVLERRKQTYRHLKTLLKPLPLDVPVRLELSPGNEIQVTLLDANHCIGACMFLVQGQGKAILYTGDVRAEPWWIQSLIRHPMILPFTGQSRRLDGLYLDTTFAVVEKPFREFPTKAEGICELLDKVSRYPSGTRFHLRAWTFGYEEIWLALSQALQSKVHLDKYRHDLYTSVAQSCNKHFPSHESLLLGGFKHGNQEQSGIVTRDETVCLHSCDKQSDCLVFRDPRSDFVDICPIVNRYNGVDVRELGAGGGLGDLGQTHELDIQDEAMISDVLTLCSTRIQDPETIAEIKKLLIAIREDKKDGHRLKLAGLSSHLMSSEDDETPIDHLTKCLEEIVLESKKKCSTQEMARKPESEVLPMAINFPFSRHSSFSELREFVGALRPKDVWPCTAPPCKDWSEDRSIESLFGHLCENGEQDFAHDRLMREAQSQRRKRKLEDDGPTSPHTRLASPMRDSSPPTWPLFIEPSDASLETFALTSDNYSPPSEAAQRSLMVDDPEIRSKNKRIRCAGMIRDVIDLTKSATELTSGRTEKQTSVRLRLHSKRIFEHEDEL